MTIDDNHTKQCQAEWLLKIASAEFSTLVYDTAENEAC